jgi:hypothetical protein
MYANYLPQDASILFLMLFAGCLLALALAGLLTWCLLIVGKKLWILASPRRIEDGPARAGAMLTPRPTRCP